MEYEVLKDLKPQPFFRWFGQICQIPHGTRNELQLAAFCEAFAQERGFWYETDAKGNVFMRVPATEGYENEPAVLLQAHLDMVCVKEPDVAFDFEQDPIRLIRRGNMLYADRTSLGADNAVGIATMLALADSHDLPHPELELLFTVEEEIGLVGIAAFDMHKIKARRMLNMDCGDSHVLAVSSAGKIAGQIEKTYPLFPVGEDETVLEVTISGGIGGHSGLTILEGRACAANEMGELMSSLAGLQVCLCSFETAEKAILKSCNAVIAVPAAMEDQVCALLRERFERIKAIYRRRDPGLSLSIGHTKAESCTACEDTIRIFSVLRFLRTGVHRVDESDPSIVVTSANIQPSSFSDGTMRLGYLIRSTNDADMEALYRKSAALAAMFGMEMKNAGQYSGWPETKDSAFRAKFQQVHTRLFGKEMELERVHGGIETSAIVAAIPDMDAVGCAPTARGAHTAQEHLYLDEVKPFWELLTAVLADR